MVNINLFQRFQSAQQAFEVTREASAGYLALVATHLFAAGWWTIDEPKPRTLIGSGGSEIATVQLLISVLCVLFWIVLRKTGSRTLSWVLALWCIVGIYHPVTFYAYGFASKSQFMIMGAYFGLLAVRASHARASFQRDNAVMASKFG